MTLSNWWWKQKTSTMTLGRSPKPELVPMSTRCSILFLLLILPRAAFSQEEGSRDELLSLRSELVQKIHQLDLSEFSAGDSVTLCLAASYAFSEAEMEELAGHYFQQAIKVASASDGKKYQYRLFDHALKIHDLESAADIAEDSDREGRFLDRLAVEKYRRGDDEALEGFPRETLDFHIALDLADAYAKRREYEKLNTFVRGIAGAPYTVPYGGEYLPKPSVLDFEDAKCAQHPSRIEFK